MNKFLQQISPPGIRVQLTLWYTIVSAGLMLIFAVAFFFKLQQILSSSFDETLEQRSQHIAEGVAVRNGRLIVTDLVDELPELDSTAAIVDSYKDGGNNQVHSDSGSGQISRPKNSNDDLATLTQHAVKNAIVRVIDLQGQTIYSTPGFAKLNLPPESFEEPRKGQPWWITIDGLRGQSLRIYCTMLVENGKIVGVVQIGQSLMSLQEELQHIVEGLLIVTPFILFFSAWVSYWMAGRAFRPIHRLTRTAREIGVRDLHQRVSVPPAKDEVRDLSIIFNEMIGRLERAFSQQRRFVADASHELRTPIAVIRSMTEVALSHPSEKEDYETILKEVNAEAERLSKLANDLLALARADEGQVQLDQEPVRLDLLASDVVESLAPLAGERKIVLSTQRLDAATVSGDAARLIQIIMSLVENALNYTNADGLVTLTVETDTAFAYLSVNDTGIGIAQQDIEHIFERFYRANPARSKAVGGSGLGLSIVDWLVQAHAGTVSVKSQLGKGSTFTVKLPLAKKDKEGTGKLAGSTGKLPAVKKDKEKTGKLSVLLDKHPSVVEGNEETF